MGVADYLEVTVDQAAAQWRQILTRVPSVNGQRQATFLPFETLMCAAAMHIVEYSRLGSSTMHKSRRACTRTGATLSAPSEQHRREDEQP
ncbi:hypothetical protein [Cellulosimicrobium sp. 22601]|uniref:hypothetical protein n=1 Tax=unclassified Cellulosimicrobium TaxID=2624466 RepID=UPI003F85631C